MSVRAYILRKVNVKFKDDEIIFERILDRYPLFNVWHHPKIFELFEDYGCDFSNQDAIGEIMLTKKGWKEFVKKFKKDDWSDEELKILETINRELEIDEDIWCECF
ncbi:MAG: hypothetical protein Q4P18_01685 [Methanobrevibacter sp.]|uniref:hypothetical protein n=1 Tax=Methanobrevibacter sp. TaxID=66852 RepID=UPI0026E03241|nr:hypothetical protein [Methanobrevibacter sp.]MDO5848228.1 hypothetical protein [Methanobrevibacter sp.]